MSKLGRVVRNRWVRLPLLTWGVYLLLAAAFLGVDRHVRQARGQEELRAVTTRLDASDPKWRWKDVEESRQLLAEADNSAIVFARLEAVIPKGVRTYPTRRNGSTLILADFPPNRVLDEEAAQLVEASLQGTKEASPYLRKLATMPAGRRSLIPTPDLVSSSWDIQVTEFRILDYLKVALESSIRRQASGRSTDILLVTLNLGRMHGDEPLLRSQLSRMSADRTAVSSLERALGLGMESGELARLQAEFELEATGDWYHVAVRGQRATAYEFGEAIKHGRLPLHDVLSLSSWCGNRAPKYLELIDEWRVRPSLPGDVAACIEALTQYEKLADLPEHLQLAAAANLVAPLDPHDRRFTASLLAIVPALLEGSLHTRALLRCAVVALAAEQHRLSTGSWPVDLAEIPASILRKIPLDPFTGKPISLVTRGDGITVYSAGFDGKDDAGAVEKLWNEPNADLGVRLYDADQRRLPPLPVKPSSGSLDD
jgi:hypothetical protein